MTTPAQAFYRFCVALVLGCGLGLYYGFLRPLRPRLTTLSDLLFLPAAGWIWIYLSFGVCAGDIRMGYTLGLFCGGFLWELTVGRLLRPLFYAFWRAVGNILAFFFRPIKIFTKKAAKYLFFLLATVKKRVTINRKPKKVETDRAFHLTNHGGARHDRRKQSFQTDTAGIPPKLKNR